MSDWTTPADIRAAVQREWDSGRLLAARVPMLEPDTEVRATGFPLRIRLRRPSAREMVNRFDEVRGWVSRLNTDGGYRIESTPVANRTLGSQDMPAAAWIDNAQQALALIRRTRDAARFDELVAATPRRFLPVVAARPIQVLELAAEWTQIVLVADWILANPRPAVHVRQVDLPGVHTKLIERHRRMISMLVDAVRPAESTTGQGWFERRYGFRGKPAMVRFRSLDRERAPLPGVSDVTIPVAELAAMPVDASRVFITENEINYLAFPDHPGSLVIFGSGHEAPQTLAALPWLDRVEVHYWGDIDTHGFVILDRLRSRVPHTRSLLMDRETLLAHRGLWVPEPTPAGRDLSNLTDAEAELYGSLCGDTFGPSVRLEQERIGFRYLRRALIQLGEAGQPESGQPTA
ncbi:MAG: DUF2220 family protein [Candidatus Nanopelagicales bacterium]|nr:DUF2220 family protein [Candidatus Nanopelagicales bacterium]